MELDRVLQYIDAHRAEYIDLLIRFCRQPSLSTTGEGIRQMLQLTEQALRDIGVSPQRLETGGNPIIYGELQGKSPRTMAFYNHYDVQPPGDPSQWITPPFEPAVRDGKLYARGAADNKDGLACRICAVDACRKALGGIPLNLKFIYEGEEEIGSPHLQQLASQWPEKIRADGYAWEGGFKVENGPCEVSLGNKGMVYVQLSARGAKQDSHSKDAPIVENPAWRLLWALGSLRDESGRILIEGFYDKVRPVTEKDRAFLDTISFDEAGMLKSFGAKEYLGGRNGKALLEQWLYTPTCNICGFVSGYTGTGSKTVLPSTATAKLDIRLVPDQDPDEIAMLLRQHLDKHGFDDIGIEILSSVPPYLADPEAPFTRSVLDSVPKIYGTQPAIYRNDAGTGPPYTLCQQDHIPAVCFGSCNYSSNIHAPNENVLLEDYVDAIKLTAAIMLDFAAR